MEVGRAKQPWYTTCVVCNTILVNHGSGRPRGLCSAKCKRIRLKQLRPPRGSILRITKSKSELQIEARMYRRNILTRLRLLIQNEKLRRGKCEWLEGCDFPLTFETLHAFDFDHRDPTQKRFMMSKIRGQSVDDVVNEMAKCDLLCANHHRVRTQRDRHHRMSNKTTEQMELFN
jgi:hypothetical protein